MKTEVLYGFHPVLEAIKAKKRVIHKLYLVGNNSKRDKHVRFLAKSLGINIEIVQSSKICSISKSDDHQGFSAIVSPVPIYNIKYFFDKYLYSSLPCLLVLLDGIMDPNNFGAILRTAYCFGISEIIIAKDRACSPTPTVSKISAGALEHISICRITNLSTTIKILQKHGVWVTGLDNQKNAINIFEVDMPDRIAIVVGSEGKGLRPLVKRQCDFLLSIPIVGQINSLNASVAAAVVLYEGYRQKNRVSV